MLNLDVTPLPNQKIRVIPFEQMYDEESPLREWVNQDSPCWLKFSDDSFFIIPEDDDNEVLRLNLRQSFSGDNNFTDSTWSMTVNKQVTVYVFWNGPLHKAKSFKKWCEDWQPQKHNCFEGYEPDVVFAKNFPTGLLELECEEFHRYFAFVVPQTKVCWLHQQLSSMIGPLSLTCLHHYWEMLASDALCSFCS